MKRRRSRECADITIFEDNTATASNIRAKNIDETDCTENEQELSVNLFVYTFF